MSVVEYEHKFNELSRFAPELIPNEEEKCRHFEEGLWLDIQAVATANTYPSMRALGLGLQVGYGFCGFGDGLQAGLGSRF
ncbi:hypothetical protein CerSpe_074020 [Prunus speciosa]